MKTFHWKTAQATASVMAMCRLAVAACWLAALAATPFAAGQAADNDRDAMAVQSARSKGMGSFGKKTYYPADKFNLDDLPAYVPAQKASGNIRIWGSDMFGGKKFQADIEGGFRSFQPDVTFEYHLKGPALAIAGLLTGVNDIGPARRVSWELLLAFERVFNHDPLVILGMTGWAVNPPFSVMVNKDNPLTQMTLKQLDGVFGAERNGGWIGTTWHPEFARGPEDNIRKWGQLGLTGEWVDKDINVYGFNVRELYGPRFSNDVLKGSDKWNERLKQYSQIAAPGGKGLYGADQQMSDELAKDPYGIAYYTEMRAKGTGAKSVALAANEGGPFLKASLETIRDHSYPLYDGMYFYLNREPGKPLEPKLKEFMLFLLSRQGQEAVARDGTMLPLTAAMIQEERRKLE